MSRHHHRWVNGEGKRQRARLAALLPQPCPRCGKPVLATHAWEADHVIPLNRWPENKPYPNELIRAAHKSCNRSHGGKDGSRITNERKRAARAREQGLRPW